MSWLEEERGGSAVSNDPSLAPGGSNPTGSGSGETNGTCIRNHAGSIKLTIRILNLGVACISAAAAVYGIANIKTGASAVGLFFVALYMLVFAIILGMYELMQFYPIEKLMEIYRYNFGFFFGIKGKAIYMIFIAFLNFGFVSSGEGKYHSLTITSGILLLAMGLINLGLEFMYKGVLGDEAN